MKAGCLRVINPEDAREVLDIYSHYIKNTVITFETEVPGLHSFRERILKVTAFYPWLVYEEDRKIRGYVYAWRYQERAAYAWAVDVSIYIDKNCHKRGIGKKLYGALFPLLKAQGFYNAYASITLPNPASVGIHEYFGFTYLGKYTNVGYKLNRWWDVGWWEYAIQDHKDNPAPLVGIHDLKNSIIDEALAVSC